ncbi:hypothetical protein F3Y22_tig00002237pilonHSYRG01993 [Hibiscus syriacus]|uniref:Uncharacterized protein n=1 Tax=Hibiscus syriacus TaxID=106335 RepID=A0A6A3CV69_HIBSY|nr:hypothetical protein F3Y22_tig00002237pilonHSYRG01993 [Hibiscus syriacus]
MKKKKGEEHSGEFSPFSRESSKDHLTWFRPVKGNHLSHDFPVKGSHPKIVSLGLDPLSEGYWTRSDTIYSRLDFNFTTNDIQLKANLVKQYLDLNFTMNDIQLKADLTWQWRSNVSNATRSAEIHAIGEVFIKAHLSHSLETNTNLSLVLQRDHIFSVDFDSLEIAERLKHPLDESDKETDAGIMGSCNGPDCDSESFIIAFDLEIEQHRVVELPDGLDISFDMKVKSMRGCLCLIADYWELKFVDIWIMNEYEVKESWTKLLSAKHSKYFTGFEFVLTIAFSKDSDKVLLNFDQ